MLLIDVGANDEDDDGGHGHGDDVGDVNGDGGVGGDCFHGWSMGQWR